MAFYTPKQDADAPASPAPDGRGLPDVLLIGDSISQGYTGPVREMLKDVCNVQRPRANCGDTKSGLANIDAWLGGRTWDLVHFNWGLHDICYRHPDSEVYGNRDKVKGTLSVAPEEYATNLERLVMRMRKSAARLVWASTTFVPEGEAGRHQGDEVRYNELAAEVMARHGVPTDDLHRLTREFPRSMFTCPGDVHYTQEGYAEIARAVSTRIRERLTGT